ncbi:MAG: hypothetical protein AAGD06_05485 [Acidobacteriota bacterium]
MDPWLAWVCVVAVLVPLVAVAVVSMAVGEPRGAGWPRLAADVAGALAPTVGDGEETSAAGPFDVNRRLLESFDAFERRLEDGSPLLAVTLPVAQRLFLALGLGNEDVIPGHGDAGEGWLLYGPGLDHVLGPPFLDPAVLERRRRSGPSWRPPPQPDPLPALLDFHRQLTDRGIDLVVVPTPTKAMLHPGILAPSLEVGGEPVGGLLNPSFAEWRERLETAGIMVFDPLDTLRALRRSGAPAFLRSDSHWSPEAVGAVAAALAAELRSGFRGLPPRRPRWQQRRLRVEGTGDLARMLEAPGHRRPQGDPPPALSTAGTAEEVEILAVEGVDGRLWRPRRGAPVLVLGDSYTNVYSEAALGWGSGAGLAEQLAFHLGLAVDRLAINDGSATAVRERLALEAAEGRDRLVGSRVVVYQIAVRELSFGDWRLVDLDSGTQKGPEADGAPGVVARD